MPSWDSLEPRVHGPRGRRGAAVRVGAFSTRHTRPGQSTAGWAVCAHIVPMTCEPAGRNTRGLRIALSTLWLTTLAKTHGGVSQRPSALAGPMFVCCCGRNSQVANCRSQNRRHGELEHRRRYRPRPLAVSTETKRKPPPKKRASKPKRARDTRARTSPNARLGSVLGYYINCGPS